MADWSLDVPIAPDAVIARLERAVTQRPKRAFGVVKVQNEFVGVIARDQFEVWERRRRAVHAVGQARGVRGGTRVEVRLVIPPPTRILIAVFFALYAVAAVGIASQPPDPEISLADLGIAAAGAFALALIFYWARTRQRRDLTDFLRAVLSAPPS